MRALTYHGTRDVRVDDVPDPKIEAPTDAIIRVTSSGICGSDLHLYEVLGPFIDKGDVLGHEPMGIVEEVGAEVTNIAPGDRVVIPFNISCGHCYMCDKGLQSQCETTQVHEQDTGAALFGYTKLYGQVPGGQAEYLRVPQAHYGPIKVPEGPPDDRFVYLSDVLPTAWQAVEYADVPEGETLARPRPRADRRDEHAHRAAPRRRPRHRARPRARAPRARPRARRRGARPRGYNGDLPDAVRELTDGRGPISVIDAVGMEAHGAPVGKLAHRIAGMLPDAIAAPGKTATATVVHPCGRRKAGSCQADALWADAADSHRCGPGRALTGGLVAGDAAVTGFADGGSMGEDSGARVGVLVLRVWIEDAGDTPFRARITASSHADGRGRVDADRRRRKHRGRLRQREDVPRALRDTAMGGSIRDRAVTRL